MDVTASLHYRIMDSLRKIPERVKCIKIQKLSASNLGISLDLLISYLGQSGLEDHSPRFELPPDIVLEFGSLNLELADYPQRNAVWVIRGERKNGDSFVKIELS